MFIVTDSLEEITIMTDKPCRMQYGCSVTSFTHTHALCNCMYVRKVKGILSLFLIKHYDVKPREEGRSLSFLNSGNAGG